MSAVQDITESIELKERDRERVKMLLNSFHVTLAPDRRIELEERLRTLRSEIASLYERRADLFKSMRSAA